MATRRNLLKSLGYTALALPTLPLHGTTGTALGPPPMPAKDDPEYWAKIRKQFALAEDKVFFNTGTVGVMPKKVVEAVQAPALYGCRCGRLAL